MFRMNRMLYRGFRITQEPAGPPVAVHTVCRGHWRKVATADTVAQAEAIVDRILADRDRLSGVRRRDAAVP